MEPQFTLPVSAEELRRNVQHALGLRLPELPDFPSPQREPLHVLANGPSAMGAQPGSRTLALNGALKLQTPTYWAACDPQELVAGFVADAPSETTYLVASRCHPAVFEALQGRKVILWHLAEDATWERLQPLHPVAGWSSITTSSLELMVRMGERAFHFWGWDCCRLAGLGHAVPQAENPEEVTAQVGDRLFKTSQIWGHEAQSALSALAGFPFPVHIHGPGMLAHMASIYLPKRVVTDHHRG